MNASRAAELADALATLRARLDAAARLGRTRFRAKSNCYR